MIRYWYILVYVLLYIDSIYICIYKIFSKKLYSPNIESYILVLPECIILSSLLFTWKYVHLCPVLCFIIFFSFVFFLNTLLFFLWEQLHSYGFAFLQKDIWWFGKENTNTSHFFGIFNFLVNIFFFLYWYLKQSFLIVDDITSPNLLIIIYSCEIAKLFSEFLCKNEGSNAFFSTKLIVKVNLKKQNIVQSLDCGIKLPGFRSLLHEKYVLEKEKISL